ncbi:PulJ/GspJ family protein [Rubritalea sp.]|uniref:PulJ/GspJ family protein n=1 Tax=Rubritalea sp. TaxID=2109375 RepID=UPI003EF377A7
MKGLQKTRKGFTLLELMVAVAITTVIIAALIGMTRMSMDAWKESSDRARASRLAKESLEVMAKDFEGMVLRSGNEYQWLYTQMDSNVERGPNNAEIANPLDLAFFTAATDRYDGEVGPNSSKDNGGDISTVFYRLVYKDQLGGDFEVYSLYRMLVNPDDTFQEYLALKKSTTDANGEEEDDDTGLEDNAPDSGIVTESENFLAENVYNMTVTYVFEYKDDMGNSDATDDEIRQVRVPITLNGDVKSLSITGSSVILNGSSLLKEQIMTGDEIGDIASLVSVELGVLVLSDSAMNTLKHKSFSSDKFNAFVKENSHYFTKSVILPRP